MLAIIHSFEILKTYPLENQSYMIVRGISLKGHTHVLKQIGWKREPHSPKSHETSFSFGNRFRKERDRTKKELSHSKFRDSSFLVVHFFFLLLRAGAHHVPITRVCKIQPTGALKPSRNGLQSVTLFPAMNRSYEKERNTKGQRNATRLFFLQDGLKSLTLPMEKATKKRTF